MADYNRTSRECNFEQLGPEIIAAINSHLEKYELGPILNDALMCIEVKSDKIKKGLFAGPGPKLTEVVLLLTPHWLVQTIKIENQPIITRSARLEDITVSDYEKSPFYARLPDHGVEVSGRFTDTNENSTSFVGLGMDAAGTKFKEMFIKAVREAKL
jgi:hypothetical protein